MRSHRRGGHSDKSLNHKNHRKFTVMRDDTAFAERPEFNGERREKTLFVGNLDSRVTEYMLIKKFEKYGEIVREQYMWHKSGEMRGQPRGYAFIEYDSRDAALKAQEATDKMMLGERRLNVRFAEERTFEDDGKDKLKVSSSGEDKGKLVKSAPRPGKFSTNDKIRAIEEKLRMMEQESGGKDSDEEREERRRRRREEKRKRKKERGENEKEDDDGTNRKRQKE